jgi:KDO2-lipid IV(A) lauroyltransferase
MAVLKERLAAGGVVCLVADRDLSRGGMEVDFFGHPTRMPAGPSLLAATTGAALLPAHLYFDGDGWGQWIGPAVDLGIGDLRTKLRTGTQSLADTFARRRASAASGTAEECASALSALTPGTSPAVSKPMFGIWPRP